MDWFDFEFDERSFCYILFSKRKGEVTAKCYMNDSIIKIPEFERSLFHEVIKTLSKIKDVKSKRKIFISFSNRHAAFFESKKNDMKLRTIEFTYSVSSDLMILDKFILSDKLKRLLKFLYCKHQDKQNKFNDNHNELLSLSDCEDYESEETSKATHMIIRMDEKELSNEATMMLDDPPIKPISNNNAMAIDKEHKISSKEVCNESFTSWAEIRNNIFLECEFKDKLAKSNLVVFRCAYFDCSPIVFFRSHIKRINTSSYKLRYNENYYHNGEDYNFNKFKPTFKISDF